MIEERWEHGSDFQWCSPVGSAAYPWRDRGALFGTGRFALDAVLHHIACRRIWLPSFYCPDVSPKDIAVAVYRDSPGTALTSLAELPVEAGDAIVVQNLYGLRASPPAYPNGAVVIEDHSHDLTSTWAAQSTADYCFASLRKTLPVADGGVVWSPIGASLPVEPALDPLHVRAAVDRLTGMLLKTAYLDGSDVSKQTYRERLVAGEQALAHGPSSTILPLTRASLPGFPVSQWRQTRASNFATFATALGRLPGITLFPPTGTAVPFVATLCFETGALRDSVRTRLLESSVYPAVLWAMDHATHAVPSDDVELSRRVLSVHCDHRYSAADMQRVANVVRRALSA